MNYKIRQYLKVFLRSMKYLIFPITIIALISFYGQALSSTTVPIKDEVQEEIVNTRQEEGEDIGVAKRLQSMFTGEEQNSQADELCRVTVLDVGQASCTVIESDGEYMIFDGGDRETSSYVVAWCKEAGIKRIKYLVASHYHSDHVYGLIGLLETDILVENVICPDYVTDTSVQGAFYERVPEYKRIVPYVSQTFAFGRMSARCISPVTDEYSDDNGYSVGFVISCGDFSMLIDGDATAETEADMLEEGIDIDADILIVPHHGSTYSSSSEWLSAVSPEVAVISCGENNSYYHPHEGVLNRLRENGVKELYRTDLQGNIVITSDGTDIYDVVTEKNTTASALWTPGQGEASDASDTSGLWDAEISVTEPYYIGNVISKKFHRPSCENLPKEQNRVLFSTRNDALSESYLPCGSCGP